MKTGYVYITSNQNRTTLYVGVTSDIRRRIYQHKFEKGSKFTSEYNCYKLLYCEVIPGNVHLRLVPRHLRQRRIAHYPQRTTTQELAPRVEVEFDKGEESGIEGFG
jgi:hypothetical protein